MSNSKLFQPVWNKYLPVIILKIKSAEKSNELQQLKMDKIDFENASNRKNTKFQFTLEMKEGRTIKNKNMSYVGNDFALALIENDTARDLIKGGHFKFILNTKFILSMEKFQAVPQNGQ